jgi:quercetin dioxygenase-like cupin family protein
MNTSDSIGRRNGHLIAGDGLRIIRWADDLGIAGQQLLGVSLGMRPEPMAHSEATGEGLVSNGFLGADIIRLAAGDGFVPHTHVADHLLIVVGGLGTITCGGKIYPTRAGDIYMVEGEVPHAVGAITDHVILAVGAPHTPVDSPNRLIPAGYQAVTARIDDLHCLICDLHARYPLFLHEVGCAHCPCVECTHASVAEAIVANGNETGNSHDR